MIYSRQMKSDSRRGHLKERGVDGAFFKSGKRKVCRSCVSAACKFCLPAGRKRGYDVNKIFYEKLYIERTNKYDEAGRSKKPVNGHGLV